MVVRIGDVTMSKKQLAISLVALFISTVGLYVFATYDDWFGQPRGTGQITGSEPAMFLLTL